MGRRVDTVGRVAGDAWQLGSTPAQETGVRYDLQSRLGTVSLGGVSATYQYQAGGTTVTGVNRPLSAVVGAPAGVMEGSLSRDAAGRVRTAHWQRRGTIRGTEVYGSVTYQYDAAGRRRQATDLANVSWHYGYNQRGEVTGAEKRAASGTVLGGWGQGYSYDDIGNRRQVVTPEGETLAVSANALNQISTRQTEQARWLRGRAHPLASVDVDGNAVTREGQCKCLTNLPFFARAGNFCWVGFGECAMVAMLP